jgi:hypothetical protein
MFGKFRQTKDCLIREQAARIAELEGERDRLRATLGEYAATGNWMPSSDREPYAYDRFILTENGWGMAKAALAPRGEGMEA